MHIYDQRNKRELSEITLYLTPEEASELADNARDLSENPHKHHSHISNEKYDREIIIAVYTNKYLNQFDRESKEIILGDLDQHA